MSFPTFDEFFRAIHPGRTPFPWQNRLADQIVQTGWPSLLDLPTGCGKTSALDIAIWALAAAPQRMPRRILLVIDRRIVVDQGAEHARGILNRLRSAREGAALEVANRLRALTDAAQDADPFAVAVLRGGMPKDNDWARRPDQPVVGVSTVDQVGSRLLFRGYGISANSASIHAGLMGNDTLLLLDEVHLAEPFAQTLAALTSRFNAGTALLPRRFFVVRMSATPGASAELEPFGLDAADRVHPVLARRLAASKLAALQVVKVSGSSEADKRKVLAAEAVRAARSLQRGGAKVICVVVNRVDTARDVRALLSDADADALLVTGRMRPLDRDQMLRSQLLARCGSRTERQADTRPLIVVATQCIEAGADLDFDGLVTECASLDALRQRFGRLDRQGLLGTSRAAVLVRSDALEDGDPDPIYGSALAQTWRWLDSIASDGVVDFGLQALPEAVDPNGAAVDVLSPKASAPVLLPTHLDAWAQTAPLPMYAPDISMWLHGPGGSTADIQLVWRAGLALPKEESQLESSLAQAVRVLGAFRPSSLEALSLPFGAARRWLAGAGGGDAVADVVLSPPDEEMEEKSKINPIVGLLWAGDASRWITAKELRPGAVLVVPSERGGLAFGNFDPSATEPVADLGIAAQLRARAQVGLRLEANALASVGIPPDAIPAPAEDETAATFRERLRQWADGWPLEPLSGPLTQSEWAALRETVAAPRQRGQAVFLDSAVCGLVATVPARLLHGEIGALVTEDDDSSFVGAAIGLSEHSADVESYAARFARAIGLSDALVSDLALAGWFHDVGKADPRFQRWLAGGSEIGLAGQDRLLAKSVLAGGSARERDLARKRAGYPKGYRHELLSLAMLEHSEAALSRAHDPELVMHLVASHHGHCRPFAPPVQDEHSVEALFTHGETALAAHTDHRLSRLDSGVSARFWQLNERYGWWGLAWLEAILRLADHRASEDAVGGAG